MADDAITWRRSDLGAEFPNGTWDLISAFYLHSTVTLERAAILRKAAAAVKPGGHAARRRALGHAVVAVRRRSPAFPSTDDVLSDVGADESSPWTVVRTGLSEVPMTDPDGNPARAPTTSSTCAGTNRPFRLAPNRRIVVGGGNAWNGAHLRRGVRT